MRIPSKPLSHFLFNLKRRNHAKILLNSPLIPPNCNKALKDGFFSAGFLDSIPKFDRASANFTQRRAISSAVPDPAASTVSSPSEAIDAGSSIRKPSSLLPGMYHSPVTNALSEARSKFFEKKSNGSAQSELIAKNPSESRTSILYKFSSDYILREQYRNRWSEILMGKLLEDLDAFAGTISFKHCAREDSSMRPLILVTASVDKMALRKPIKRHQIPRMRLPLRPSSCLWENQLQSTGSLRKRRRRSTFCNCI